MTVANSFRCAFFKFIANFYFFLVLHSKNQIPANRVKKGYQHDVYWWPHPGPCHSVLQFA